LAASGQHVERIAAIFKLDELSHGCEGPSAGPIAVEIEGNF
jgi:hypothetical protein